MLGLRGVRLGIQIPGLFLMQARAIAEAAADRMAAHGTPAPGDHGAAGRQRARARDRPRRASSRRSPRCEEARGRQARHRDRHDDRAAARRVPRRPDRQVGRLLLLRHQRPHPDGVGLLARRRRGVVLLPLLRARHLRRLAVRVARPARRRRDGRDGHDEGPRDQARPQGRRVRRARRRPALGALLRPGRPRLRLVLAVPRARSPGSRPDARCSEHSATQKSAEARLRRPASTRGSSLPTAANRPSRWSRALAGPGRPCGRRGSPAG